MKVIFTNAYTQTIINEFEIFSKDTLLNMITDFTNNEYVYIKSLSGEFIKVKYINFVEATEGCENELFFNLFFILDKKSEYYL